METDSFDINTIFIQLMEKKGVHPTIIPRFIKDLINTNFDDPSLSLFQINGRLHLLGWDEIMLDYHTFQLAKAYMENESVTS